MENKTKYIEAIGRRKTSIARVRLWKSNKLSFKINDKDISYFPTKEMQLLIQSPFKEIKNENYEVTARIKGGGSHSQAEALRHGISRAITKEDEMLRKNLKQAGLLKRDPRAKERRKFGLKKARKAPQWSKR
jgi:small subunit ribosomal protein S9